MAWRNGLRWRLHRLRHLASKVSSAHLRDGVSVSALS